MTRPSTIPADSDPFPFGKHKGVPYEKVPASYLDWLSDQPWLTEWPAVKRYIDYNRDVINQELEERK